MFRAGAGDRYTQRAGGATGKPGLDFCRRMGRVQVFRPHRSMAGRLSASGSEDSQYHSIRRYRNPGDTHFVACRQTCHQDLEPCFARLDEPSAGTCLLSAQSRDSNRSGHFHPGSHKLQIRDHQPRGSGFICDLYLAARLVAEGFPLPQISDYKCLNFCS